MQPDQPDTAPVPLPAPGGVLAVVRDYLRQELAHLPADDREELLALAAELVHSVESVAPEGDR